MSLPPGRSGQVLADVVVSGRGALVGYLPVGYPDVPTSMAAWTSCARAPSCCGTANAPT